MPASRQRPHEKRKILNYLNLIGKFGLSKNPFKDTLDTELFFRTKQHEKALVKIRIGIEDRHALILLTGSSGTGKTLVSQILFRDLDLSRYEPAFVLVYPGMGKGALLGAILNELGVREKRGYVNARLELLQEKALALHSVGRRLVVIIDETHFLKADALHILRSLSNLETEEEKLVTVLLVSEDSIRRRLRAPSYASLRGRITFSLSLQPLTVSETEQYIKYRLLKCGSSTCLLTEEAFRDVHRLSRGIPREINKLLYSGLLEAITTDDVCITPETLLAADQSRGAFHG